MNREDPLPTWEDELFSSSFQKILSKLEMKYKLNSTSIYRFHKFCCGGLFGDVSRVRQLTQRLALLQFHRCFLLAFSVSMFWTIGRYNTVSRNYSTTRRLLLSTPFDPLPLGLRILEHRAKCVPSAICQKDLAILRSSFFRSFQPFLLRFAPKCPRFQ
uniref:Uncharacterized protein n=1 Tax=Solanum tuberosum TaxID=4113 RepID=M1DM37_SOLTU